MNAPAGNARVNPTPYLLEQPVLQTVRLKVFYPERQIPGGGPGWAGQRIDAHWGEVLVVAVRRPEYPTNEAATRAIPEVLSGLGVTTNTVDAAISLADMLGERNSNLQYEIEALSSHLAHDAHELRIDVATLSALEAYLPFTVELHPSPSSGICLDSQESIPFTTRISMLMLAWLIVAKL